jgi:hypothetical protein
MHPRIDSAPKGAHGLGRAMTDILHIETSIRIAASPERVWAVLVDFAGYPRWNPWVVEVAGGLVPGSLLAIRSVHVPGQKPTPSRVRLVSADFPEMHWEGGHEDASYFRGNRRFRCAGDGDGCLFGQAEAFTGAAAEAILRHHGDRIRANFERFNEALKLAAER